MRKPDPKTFEYTSQKEKLFKNRGEKKHIEKLSLLARVSYHFLRFSSIL